MEHDLLLFFPWRNICFQNYVNPPHEKDQELAIKRSWSSKLHNVANSKPHLSKFPSPT